MAPLPLDLLTGAMRQAARTAVLPRFERAKRLYEKAASLAEEQAAAAEKAARAAQAEGGNDKGTDTSGVSPEKIRAKLVIVDRQMDESGKTGRQPASSK